ncbi:MAG: aldehyde dehydrogenase family protein [Allorhizobium sp.]
MRAGWRSVSAELVKGAFVAPTIFTGVTNDTTIAPEEIFEAVAYVIAFNGHREEEAIANDPVSTSPTGSGPWTSDRRTRTLSLIMDMLSLRCHLARLWMPLVR